MTPLITPADRIFVAGHQSLGRGRRWRQKLMRTQYSFRY
jgi:hypothetical protein